MTLQEKISYIAEFELEVTLRVSNDKSFRPSEEDEYSERRNKVEQLREEIKELITSKDYLKDNPLIKTKY